MMKKLLSFCLLFLLMMPTGIAQTTFNRVYYKPYEYMQSGSVAMTFDGSYIIGGSFAPGWNNFQNFVFKINAAGDTVWNKIIPGNVDWNDRYQKILALKDTTLLFVGINQNTKSSRSDLLWVKMDYQGNLISSASFSANQDINPRSVCQTYDSGIVITGSIHTSDPYNNNLFAIKIDDGGNLQWSEMMTGENLFTYGYAVKQTSDTGYIITGALDDRKNSIYHYMLMKLNSEGNVEWSAQYGLSDAFYNAGDILPVNNGYLVAMGHDYDSAVIMKTDLSGQVLWAKNYNIQVQTFMEQQPFIRIIALSGGGYIIGVSDRSESYDILMKTDSTGSMLWSKEVRMYLTGVAEMPDKGFMILGNGPLQLPKFHSNGEPQIGLIKTDSLGESQGECIIDHTIPFIDATLIRDTLAATWENLNLTLQQPELQLVSDTITIRSGCVDIVGAVNDTENDPGFSIFPNPVGDELHVRFSPERHFKQALIFDMYGKNVFEGLPEITCHVGNLPKGVYLFVLTDENGIFETKKFIKR